MKKFFLLIAFALILGGCINFNNPDTLPHFSDFKIVSVNPKSFSEYVITVGATVENPVNKKFAAKSFTAKVYRKGKPFADIVLTDPLLLEQLYLGKLNGTFKVKLLDLKNAMFDGININNLNYSDYTLDITTSLKAGGISKRFTRTLTGEQLYSLLK